MSVVPIARDGCFFYRKFLLKLGRVSRVAIVLCWAGPLSILIVIVSVAAVWQRNGPVWVEGGLSGIQGQTVITFACASPTVGSRGNGQLIVKTLD
jgi:hypothetical protein